MRVDADQRIAGFPAVEVRRLMRKAIKEGVSLRQIQESLGCSKPVASSVLGKLQHRGFLRSTDGRLEVTVKGGALALATAAKPLLRSGAERLVSELVRRAKLVNADDRWAYKVDRLVLFGGFVKGVERPNDVDVACKLVPRWSGDVQADAEQHRRELYNGRFRNTVHCVYWPQFEVLRFLKSRSRGLSMHALDDWVLKQDKRKVIFRDGQRE